MDYELAFPVRGGSRLITPLFTSDGNEKRWTASSIDRTLDGVMNACLTEEERQHRTFHSKRVWLGSAFKHLKFSEGEIQALVHWRSEDSIRIYGRMDEIYQMNAREKAASASFTVMNASSFYPGSTRWPTTIGTRSFCLTSSESLHRSILMLETSWKGLSICRMHSLKGD